MKDYFGYQDKVCVVTGAASGMGKATCEMLVDLGAKVYALDVSKIELQGAKRIQVNLGDKASIDAAFEKIPEEIDAFFGIAGVAGVKTDFETTVIINMIANKYMTEEYLTKRMKPGGAIVYITSRAGVRWEKPEIKTEVKSLTECSGWDATVAALKALGASGMPGPMGYIFSKRAMNYYAATIIKPFGEKKVRVNVVLPVMTDTGLIPEFTVMSGGAENLLNSAGFSGRLAESREMAEPLVFLCSEMASYISGVMLNVDYGHDMYQTAGFAPDDMTFCMFSQ